MSLTKFTTHLDERRRWWVHIISAMRTFKEHFVSARVLSSSPGWNMINDVNAVFGSHVISYLRDHTGFLHWPPRAARMPAVFARWEFLGWLDRRERRAPLECSDMTAWWEKRYMWLISKMLWTLVTRSCHFALNQEEERRGHDVTVFILYVIYCVNIMLTQWKTKS